MIRMSSFIVRARSDGRGGIPPFNSYGAKEAGARVKIGDQSFKVGKDGRVNIPSRIMNEYGVRGADGRMRITIDFASKPGKNGWKDVGAVVSKPQKDLANAKTGDIQTKTDIFEPEYDTLEPRDSGDFNWSP